MQLPKLVPLPISMPLLLAVPILYHYQYHYLPIPIPISVPISESVQAKMSISLSIRKAKKILIQIPYQWAYRKPLHFPWPLFFNIIFAEYLHFDPQCNHYFTESRQSLPAIFATKLRTVVGLNDFPIVLAFVAVF